MSGNVLKNLHQPSSGESLDVGGRLKNLRQKRSLSQRDLFSTLNCDNRASSFSPPSLALLRPLCQRQAQVFSLLESIYSVFDRIAKQRRIYKVRRNKQALLFRRFAGTTMAFSLLRLFCSHTHCFNAQVETVGDCCKLGQQFGKAVATLTVVCSELIRCFCRRRLSLFTRCCGRRPTGP